MAAALRFEKSERQVAAEIKRDKTRLIEEGRTTLKNAQGFILYGHLLHNSLLPLNTTLQLHLRLVGMKLIHLLREGTRRSVRVKERAVLTYKTIKFEN